MSNQKKTLPILLLMTLLQISHIGSAQRKIVDSLKNLLLKNPLDTQQLFLYNSLGKAYLDIGIYDSSVYYSVVTLRVSSGMIRKVDPALPLMRKSIRNRISAALNNLGIVSLNQGNYSRALHFYLRSLRIDIEDKDMRGIAKKIGNIGIVFHFQGDYPKALQFYSMALRIEEENNNKAGIYRHLGNMGLIYKEQGNTPKALQCYFKALKISEELGNKIGISPTLEI